MTLQKLIARSWKQNHLFSVLLELTYRCNLDCFFCYNDLGLDGRALRLEQYVALLDDLAAMNVLNLTLSGGEPLAHPHFFSIGRAARERGFVVRVKSNGHALRAGTLDRLCSEVDPFLVEVSLHGGTAATHDRQTRVAGSFVRLLENLQEMRARNLRVRINSTLTLWNEKEVEEMFAIADRFAYPLRFDLQVSPRDDGDRTPLTIGPSQEGISRLVQTESERYRRLSDGAEIARRPLIDDDLPASPEKYCGAGSAGIAIDPYGNVYPCVQWRRSAGNLHDSSISELWGKSPVLEGVRRETIEIRGEIQQRADASMLNFCPGLAEALTGSSRKIPPEVEHRAEAVSRALQDVTS